MNKQLNKETVDLTHPFEYKVSFFSFSSGINAYLSLTNL